MESPLLDNNNKTNKPSYIVIENFDISKKDKLIDKIQEFSVYYFELMDNFQKVIVFKYQN